MFEPRELTTKEKDMFYSILSDMSNEMISFYIKSFQSFLFNRVVQWRIQKYQSQLLPGDIGIKNESTIMNHCGIYAGDGKWFETNVFYGAQLTDCSLFKHFFRIKNIDD